MSATALLNRNTKAKREIAKPAKIADKADRHRLYQASVQNPEIEISLFVDKYKDIFRREPMSMREDFCGTAYLTTEWCKTNPNRIGIGVDLCSDTLDWGVANNVMPAGKNVANRIHLLNENVLTVQTRAVDLICAMNFSYCTFKTRAELRSYFENTRRGLNDEGLFFLDLLGGPATIDTLEEEREVEDDSVGDFIYIWDQAYFNPIDHAFKCHIHFRFKDKSKVTNAFSYDWRLWTIPELNELLLEAGFSKVHFFWEEFADDEDDPKSKYMVGTGNYLEVREVEQQESWLVYIAAEK